MLVIMEHDIFERTDDPRWYCIVAGAGLRLGRTRPEHVHVATVAEQTLFVAVAEMALVATVADQALVATLAEQALFVAVTDLALVA